jgi:predicted MPP superfamily phosphohydrolase
MDTQKFLPYLIVLIIVALALEVYMLMTLKKTILKSNWNKIYYRIPIFISIVMAISGLIIIYFRTNNQDLGQLGDAVFFMVKLWYIPKFLLLPFMLSKDGILLLRNLAKKITGGNSDSNEQIDLKKRRMLSMAGIGFVAIPYAAVADGLLRTTSNYKIEKVEIPLYRLPRELDGLKIVQISDIHAGNFVSKEDFREVTDKINALKPDIIAITGDFVNFHPMEIDLIEEGFSGMKATYGVYACLGNHDHYMDTDDHLELKRKIISYGIDLLVDTNRVIERNGANLNIAGIDNIGGRVVKGDFSRALKGIDINAPTIMLAHDPITWDSSVVNSLPIDLMLSGHTHGGQIGLNIFGDIYTPAMFFNKRFSGLYNEGGQYLYVNRGIATTSLPVRISIYPEITEITLRTNPGLI